MGLRMDRRDLHFCGVLSVAVIVSLATFVMLPERAEAQAAGAAVAAQEAGAIFSDERIRALAERRIRTEEIQTRIEEIQLIQQLETVDPQAARIYRARLGGGTGGDAATASTLTDEFFEAYDKTITDRGVVLPILVAVQGSGDDLIAQIGYGGQEVFVRPGQLIDDYLRISVIESTSIIVEIRGRKFRIPLSGR
ncbi:MAG: hypothetical protein OD811_01825 [Alphaproteobacteria bacterium]